MAPTKKRGSKALQKGESSETSSTSAAADISQETERGGKTSARVSVVSTSSSRRDAFLTPLKVRDYAFGETDPRHVGARDVSAPSQRESLATGSSIFGGIGGGVGGGGGGPLGGFGSFTGMFQSGGQQHSVDWGLTQTSDSDDSDEDDGNENQEEEGLPHGLYHAVYDFAAESEHELSVSVGEKVRLVGHVDGGWAVVVKVLARPPDQDEEHGAKGLVPEAYLEWLDH